MMHDKPMVTARELIAALRKLPPDMPVSFMPIDGGWLGSMKPLHAFQVNVWNAKGNQPRKPYPKTARAEIYVGTLP
jgi:hypothetical protein